MNPTPQDTDRSDIDRVDPAKSGAGGVVLDTVALDTVVSEREAAIAHIEQLAWLLDSSIKVPVLNYRIGPESLIGLIPGIGDLVGGGLTAYLILLARRHGAPLRLQAKMLGIALFDFLIGIVPLLGDWLDFAHKANARIATLLAEHLRGQKRPE